MTAPQEDTDPGLPIAATRLIGGLVAVGLLLAAAAVAVDPNPLDPRWAGLFALGVIVGEALRIDLPYKRGGTARFSLSDAALTAALLTLAPTTVVVGATIGTLTWQLAERVSPVKALFNTAQYLAGAAGAALLVQMVAPARTGVGGQTLGAVTLGLGFFLVLQVLTVGGIIAATGGGGFLETTRRLGPTSATLSIGNACLGLVAMLLSEQHAWALPALAVPLVLLHSASRSEVRATLARERATGFVELEHRLAEAPNPDHVAVALVDGVREILGGAAAVWRDGAWATAVPAGSAACPVDARLAAPLTTRGAALGPAIEGTCMAVGVGGGVLVAWDGDLPLARDAEEWLERIGRSGRIGYERVEAAAALRRERATLRTVVLGTKDGIFVLDAADAVRLWNPAMADLSATTTEAADGRHVLDVLGPGPWGEEGVHDVVVGRGEEGAERVWRVAVAAMSDAVHGMLRVAVVHDVSAERRAARMRDDMLSVVSHELRTPLTPIKAGTQLLRRRWDKLSPERREELLGQMEHRTDHLSRLVEDLLLVGQLSDGDGIAPTVRPMPGDLATVVASIVGAQKEARPDHEVTLSAPASLPAMVDTMRLRQVLDNLIDNACKFSAPGTRIDVTLTADGDVATLRIGDQGRGIPAADLERVFERFERVEDPLLMTTSGAGLGLFIVRALVRGFGGTTTISSVLGAGTTVTLRLPLLTLPETVSG